ncbi:MAG: hypothetical protein QOE31_1055 [Solirubrobacteraceae bacterium]|jgi:hypothetical protein|nr:hypothetical protein [Solirubrobacteraceae bacterium]
MNDTRTSIIGAGAAAVAGSLWAPWYAIDFGPAARRAIGGQTGQLPGVLGEFTRQLLTVIPTHIEATGWQVFDKADVMLFACAIVALFAALIDRMDITVFAGGAAGGLTVVQMLDHPGPGELVTLRWGPWLALAGALVIAGASRIGSERPAEAPATAPDWTKPSVPLAPGADPTHSFPPF